MFTRFISFLVAMCFVLPTTVYANRDMFKISVSDDTPATFFNSGIESYYVSSKSIISIKYRRGSSAPLLTITPRTGNKINNINGDTEALLYNVVDASFVFNDDGTVLIKRIVDDHSCYNNSSSNCIYSDILIKDVVVENLRGKAIDYDFVSSSFDDEEKFNIGSKVYTFLISLEKVDFNSFDEFDSLVCTKNAESVCKIFATTQSSDLIELLELRSLNNIDVPMIFAEGDEDTLYAYSQKGNTLTPYSRACLKTVEEAADVNNCIDSTLPAGSIKAQTHPMGMNYWYVDFNNVSINNKIYWTNKEGVAFKANTNSAGSSSLKTLNRIAVDIFVELN